PPSQILPDAQTAIRVGKNRLRAMVTDDSTVKQVAMELYSNTSTTKTKVVCAITATKTWQCEFTVPRTWRFVYYRLRAVDAYGGVSRWTEWYRASIDRDAPSFDLSDATVAMLAANTIGGAGINLTGAISDTGSLAKMVVCDDTMAVCGATPLTSGSTATPLLVSGTVTKTTPIAAQPCSALDADSYTRYPIPLSDPDYLRVTSLALTLKLAHPAPAELALLLQSPSGTIVPLVDAATATAQQLHVRFLDTAPNTITTLPSDTPMPATPEDIHPAVALTTFSGEIMRGTWYVLACDTTANAASGSIQSATLALTASSQLTSAGLGAAWTFPLTNTDGVDSEPRNIKLWAMDAANNASPARSYTVNIDTVAPQLSATQVITQILNGGSGTVLSGMVTDGGAIDRVIANVYNGAVQVSSASLPLTPSVVPSASLYALRGGRSVASAAWNLSYTDTTLDPGTYAIQLTAYDRVGNARTSEVFTLTVPEIIPPTVRATRAHSSSGPSGVTIDARINPGNAPTTVTMHLALDSEISHNPSQSLISTWSSDGNVITSGVLSDISPLANERYRQIADNGRDVIVLTASGIITNIVPSATQSRDYTLPASVNEVTQISLGADHLLAVYSDGTIAGSGSNSTGQTTIPTGLGRVAAVAAGTGYSLALLESGVVTGWGLNDAGQTTIPVIAQSGVRQIVAGPTHALAIGLDGGVIAWGDNSNAKTVIPQAAQHSIIQIAAGTQHSLALTDDGNVVAWGSDSAGQVSVPPEAIDVVAIYAAGTTSAAVTRSGTVIFWGTVVSPPLENPALLAFSDTRIIAVHGYESTTRTTIVPAGSESLTVTVPFTSLLLNRRYRYTITATNRNGTTIVSDTYITQATPSTLFVPYVSTETGFTPVSVVTK
ncbi:MAG: hypothetical protein RLZZ297_1471, partial [Chloroflexota bacterium]